MANEQTNPSKAPKGNPVVPPPTPDEPTVQDGPANALELREGARILVQVTVNEDPPKKTLKAGKYPIQGNEKDGRFIQRNLGYPFPEGLIDDPFTGKMAKENMTLPEIAKAIEVWLQEVAVMKANGGWATAEYPQPDGTSYRIPANQMEMKPVPSLADLFEKGFKLAIQGPVNAQMVKDQIVIADKKGTITKAAKDLKNFG